MYSHDELFKRSLECYLGVYLPHCVEKREMNTKITLLWVHKQFTTWVPTLCYMSVVNSKSAQIAKFISLVQNQIW